MLKLSLANGFVVEVEAHEDNAIMNREALVSVFSGTAIIVYDNDTEEADINDLLFRVESYEDITDYTPDNTDLFYMRITKAEWKFAETDFQRFVQSEMNRYCEEGADWVYDVVYHGCAGGTVGSLIYTNDILKVLSEHARDIQYKVQEIAENIGGEFMDFTEFTFDNLVWMVFEETVRDALLALGLEDV